GIYAETAGADFTPHILTVETGEDVAAKINSVGQSGQKGHRGVCVLSANGTVSSVTIRQPGTSAGLLTYEVVIGSFVPYGYKTQVRKQQHESPTAAAIPATINWPAEIMNEQSAPQVSEAGPPEVGAMPAQNQNEADDGSIGNGHTLNVVSPHNNTVEWNNESQTSPQQRIYPDINVSLP
ncbi:AT-hook motif nuclear-localized protein 1, partial [Bienertia sinuspersici]